MQQEVNLLSDSKLLVAPHAIPPRQYAQRRYYSLLVSYSGYTRHGATLLHQITLSHWSR
jgi:hypothetical protein